MEPRAGARHPRQPVRRPEGDVVSRPHAGSERGVHAHHQPDHGWRSTTGTARRSSSASRARCAPTASPLRPTWPLTRRFELSAHAGVSDVTTLDERNSTNYRGTLGRLVEPRRSVYRRRVLRPRLPGRHDPEPRLPGRRTDSLRRPDIAARVSRKPDRRAALQPLDSAARRGGPCEGSITMTVRPFVFITACLLTAGCAGRTSAPLADITSAPGVAPTSSVEETTAPPAATRGPVARAARLRAARAPRRRRASSRPSDAFRIGPEDVLDVQVWKNEELSRVVPVRPDGMISLPLVNDIRAAGLTAGRTAAGDYAAPLRVRAVAGSLGDGPRGPQRQGGGARRRAHARPLRGEELRHGAGADRARPGAHRVRRPRADRRPAAERHRRRPASPSTIARSPKGPSRTTSTCAPATSSSFPEERRSMARDPLSTTSDDSLALRVVEIFRRRALLAVAVFATVLGAAISFALYLPGPVSRVGAGPGGAVDFGVDRQDTRERRAREPSLCHQAGDPQPRPADRADRALQSVSGAAASRPASRKC